MDCLEPSLGSYKWKAFDLCKLLTPLALLHSTEDSPSQAVDVQQQTTAMNQDVALATDCAVSESAIGIDPQDDTGIPRAAQTGNRAEPSAVEAQGISGIGHVTIGEAENKTEDTAGLSHVGEVKSEALPFYDKEDVADLSCTEEVG